jgi:quinol monooxygenase YgiN
MDSSPFHGGGAVVTHIMARYRVKRGKVDETRRAVADFVQSVGRKEAGTLLYEAYQEEDGVTFVHLMAFRDDKAQEEHRRSAYLRKFVQMLFPCCDEGPVFTDLRLLASTRGPASSRCDPNVRTGERA